MVNEIGAFVPKRGDVILLNFSPQRGHEQAGQRPALVLSSETYNRRTGMALVCPITSKRKGYPFEVRLLLPEHAGAGVVLADQVRSIDWRARYAEPIGFLLADSRQGLKTVRETIRKIKLLMEK